MTISDNWIVNILENALTDWNGKLSEIWALLTQTPQSFKGGDIWTVITGINGALQAIGCALLVLFFVMGIIKTCGSFTEIKKPEMVFTRAKLAEAVHAELYMDAYNNIDAPTDEAYYLCPICGYIHKGDDFEKCPICFTPADKFRKFHLGDDEFP